MTTVQQVFDIAITLMDEQSETTGKTQNSDNQEYRFRTLPILAALLPQLGAAATPVLPQNPADPDFSQPVLLEDCLCLGVLPYGLASHLLAGENERLAAWFQERFREGVALLKDADAAEFKPIGTPYGLF